MILNNILLLAKATFGFCCCLDTMSSDLFQEVGWLPGERYDQSVRAVFMIPKGLSVPSDFLDKISSSHRIRTPYAFMLVSPLTIQSQNPEEESLHEQ